MKLVTQLLGRLTIVMAVAALIGMSPAGAGTRPAGAEEVAPTFTFVEQEEILCRQGGGQWIEMTDDDGYVTAVSCMYPDGTELKCDGMGHNCKTIPPRSVGPTTPTDAVPGTGQVGNDLGLSPNSPQTVPAVDGATPDDDQGASTDTKSKKQKKGKKGGKARRK